MTTCLCDTDSGRQCQFHARAPRPCPVCTEGTLQRYSGHDGHAVQFVPRAAHTTAGKSFYLRGAEDRERSSSSTFWACNRCEHAEVAR